MDKDIEIIIGSGSKPKRWKGEKKLPLTLQSRFAFYQVNDPENNLLLVTPKMKDFSPSGLIKQIKMIQKYSQRNPLLVLESISDYQREKFIEESLPFFISKDQIFASHPVSESEEYSPARIDDKKEYLSYLSQVILLRQFNLKDIQNIGIGDLAKTLSYSPIAIGRAFQELKEKNFVSITMKGRKKHIHFPVMDHDFFMKVSEMMRSPVKERYWFRFRDRNRLYRSHLPIDDESLLSIHSDISAPDIPYFATHVKDEYLKKEKVTVQKVKRNEDPDCAVNVWYYDPRIISEKNHVDLFSLYLQFRHHGDERLASCAEYILTNIFDKESLEP